MKIKKKHDSLTSILQFGKATLDSDKTLNLKSEFDNVKVNGTKYVGKYFLLVHTKAPDNRLRFGVVCGRKFNKNAVCRNRARRLIKESFRLIKSQICESHIVFIPRKRMIGKKLQDIQAEMIFLLKKAKLWTK